MTQRSVAIDGPSGAGKSTLAKALARELGYLYVDTGAIYRTLGLAALRRGLDPSDQAAVLPLLPTLTLDMAYADDGLQHMFLDGEDVTEAIREHRVSEAASRISAIPAVRAYLLDMQRALARQRDVVMDGRDIGTVVLPEAGAKIFLTAAPEARARRRYEELLQRGQQADFEGVLRDVLDRDYRDTHRSAAPLKQAPDALILDTTDLTPAQSLEALTRMVKEKLTP